ncbi:MAG TPA: inverse autotransporter beta domain-containing protein, partial [Elusimicrobiales bacterium]|nr:inverse autotransporter beta domain-containing protein [Elusimicrobiales bacterium]
AASLKPAQTSSVQLPNWLQRTKFGLDVGKEQKPRYYFETVQPLYQEDDLKNTIFIAPRLNKSNANVSYGTYNIGFGWRRLMLDNNMLLGLNSFWDARTNHEHYRMGFGAEAFYKLLEFRANSYVAMSPQRLVSQSGVYDMYERAVSGFDLEAGIPVPYVNWVNIYGGMYWYDYRKSDNKTGWTARAQFNPLKFLTSNFIAFDDNKGKTSYRVDTYFSIPFDFDGFSVGKDSVNVGISDEAWPGQHDQSGKVLNRVERQYDIEVEKWAVNRVTRAIIEIKRGN